MRGAIQLWSITPQLKKYTPGIFHTFLILTFFPSLFFFFFSFYYGKAFALLQCSRESSSALPIPLESRQWLFPFKAATFSTLYQYCSSSTTQQPPAQGGGKAKMQNSKGESTQNVAFSFCLKQSYAFLLCFSISQPNACTLAFTFSPPSRLNVCVCTHTHTTNTECPTLKHYTS